MHGTAADRRGRSGRGDRRARVDRRDDPARLRRHGPRPRRQDGDHRGARARERGDGRDGTGVAARRGEGPALRDLRAEAALAATVRGGRAVADDRRHRAGLGRARARDGEHRGARRGRLLRPQRDEVLRRQLAHRARARRRRPDRPGFTRADRVPRGAGPGRMRARQRRDAGRAARLQLRRADLRRLPRASREPDRRRGTRARRGVLVEHALRAAQPDRGRARASTRRSTRTRSRSRASATCTASRSRSCRRSRSSSARCTRG